MIATAKRASQACIQPRACVHLGAGIVAALVFAGAAACGPGRDDSRRMPQNHIVEMRDLAFNPAEVMVSPGDTVTWINRDIVPHTATSASGTWDSGEIASGAEYRLVIGDGDNGDYVCAFHPGMQGRIAAR